MVFNLPDKPWISFYLNLIKKKKKEGLHLCFVLFSFLPELEQLTLQELKYQNNEIMSLLSIILRSKKMQEQKRFTLA